MMRGPDQDPNVRDRRFRRRLDAAAAGDPSACRWLWDRYAGQITGFLVARGTPDHDEVVNDVFLAAFGGLGRFEGGEADFRAWIHRIARNKRVDAIRRTGRRPVVFSADEDAAAAQARDTSEDGSAESEAIAVLEDAELRAVLDALTPDQRDVIVLRFIADLSLEQTAVVLDKPVGAVKSLQHRAVDQLRGKFSAHPYPPSLAATMS